MFLGVDAGVFGDAGCGCGQVHQAVETGEHFFVADGVEGVEMAQGQQGAGLVDESAGHHGFGATVDAVEEGFARVAYHHLDGAEGALAARTGEQGGVGHACLH